MDRLVASHNQIFCMRLAAAKTIQWVWTESLLAGRGIEGHRHLLSNTDMRSISGGAKREWLAQGPTQ